MDELKYEKIPQDEEDEIEDDRLHEYKETEAENAELIKDEAIDVEDLKYDSKVLQQKLTKEEIKFKTVSLEERKLLLRELINEGSSFKKQAGFQPISPFQVLLSGRVVRLKILYLNARDESHNWGIWKGHMKKIGGQFGNGVLSYFTFLRWLFYLNLATGLLALVFIMIPTLSFSSTLCMKRNENKTLFPLMSSSNSTPGNKTLELYDARSCTANHQKYNFQKDNVQNVIDFFQGTGWMNTTVMFYGRYENSFLIAFSGWIYNLPLAYLLTSFAYLLISLYSIISTAVKIFEEGYVKGGESNAFSFSNTLFGSWDMCIMKEETAYLTSASITRELEAAVEETKHKSEKEQRTKNEMNRLKAIRVVINITIILLLCGGGFAIYKATKWSIDGANAGLSKQNFMSMLKNYASPITITAVNIILPTLFYKLSEFEKMSPRTKLNMDLARTVLVKLASICVLVVTIFQRNRVEYVSSWENILGAEMYKLIWTDFIVSILTTLLVEFPMGYIGRNVDAGCKLNEKIGIPEFHIPKNVLDLIYTQTIIWIGTFYSPLLPMMGSAKLFFQFYVQKGSLMTNFNPPKKPYRAGKSNYFFMVLQLISFALSLVATVYAVTQETPSNEYGPFRGFTKMCDIISLTIADLPGIYRYIFYSLLSPVVVLSIFLVLCLAVYYYRAMYQVYSKSACNLQIRLQQEQQEKKKLVKELSKDSKHFAQGVEKKGLNEIEDIDSRDKGESPDNDVSWAPERRE